jgi:hypothetical protein
MQTVQDHVRERALTLPRNLMREEQRAESRLDGDEASAALFVRGRAWDARVINLSARGTMLESDARPALDEHVVVVFDGCTPVHASVRWVRGGRIGLHFGRELVLA